MPSSALPLRRLLPVVLLAGLALLLVLAPGAWADALSPESGAGSRNADAIDDLYWLIMVMAIIVFLGVEGVLFYSLFKFRARKNAVAAQIHGNTQLEIGWTVGAAIILVFITAVTFVKLGDIKDPEATASTGLDVPRYTEKEADRDQSPPPGGRALNIDVDGQQYVWRFGYPALNEGDVVFEYEEMVVPVNTTVTLDISSDDVQHSWWIPDLGGKADALPGYTNKTWFKADKVGVYEGQCAELCGRNHANMLARVRVLPVDEFERWYAEKAASIEEAREEAAEGREREARQSGSVSGAEGGGTPGGTDLEEGNETE